MKRPYQSMKNFCEKQAEKLKKGIERMEHMEQSADQSMQKRMEQKAVPMAEKEKTQENAL